MIDQVIKGIDQQIEDLQVKRSTIIRNQVVTIGQLLDIEKELDESLNERMIFASYRLRRILEKLAVEL